MERKVEFYNIIFKEFGMYKLSTTPEEIKESFIKLITSSLKEKEYMLKMYKDDDKPSIIIQIIEINNSFLFGILGKLDDLSNKMLIRIRGKGKEEIHKTSSAEDLNYYIENFTYFYIRFDDLCCAVLNNCSAPSFKKYFSKLLDDEVEYKNNYFDEVYVIPKIENDVCDKISRFKNIGKISMAFCNEESSAGNKILSLNEIFNISQSSIEWASIDITLKSEANKKLLKERLSSCNLYYDFSKFKISGVDENDIEQCVDVLEHLLTRKVFIDIEEEYLMAGDNEQKIKEALASVLPIV